MNNTFEFVGKIIPCKETDKFKPFSDTRFNKSDWAKKQIKFNMVCGNNRHFVEASSLYNAEHTDTMTIYTVSKGTTSDNGEKTKGEKMKIPFKDRAKPEVIEKVAEFKKFVVDTEVPKRRYNLEKAIDKFKDGSITDEQMESLGVHNIEECEKALADSKKKRHEFISEYDFVDFLNKFVNNEKIKDMMFRATGDYTLEYNEKSDVWYREYVVTRIYRVENDAETKSEMTLNLVFGREAVDEENFDTTKKYHINGYLSQYLSTYKKNFFCPMTLTIDGNGDEKAEKKATAFKKKFVFADNNERDYREIGLVCNVLDGSQKVELTEDMLTEEQRENLEFGLITMEDIQRELGKDIYGEKVTDVVVSSLARGYSGGAKDTDYAEKDFGKPRAEISEDDEEDLFDEDDI